MTRHSKGSSESYPTRPSVTTERAGIRDSGYLDKKGTPSGNAAKFNSLPPGERLENQANCDVREMPMRTYSGGINHGATSGDDNVHAERGK